MRGCPARPLTFTHTCRTIGVFEGAVDPPPHHAGAPVAATAADSDDEPGETLRRLLYKRPGNPDLARTRDASPSPGQWDSRYATLWSLATRLSRMSRDHALYNDTAALYAEEVAIKATYDAAFEAFTRALLLHGRQEAAGDGQHADAAVMMAAQLARPVPYHDWPCYQAAIAAVQATCGRISDYALRYMRLLALACTLHGSDAVVASAAVACKDAVALAE